MHRRDVVARLDAMSREALEHRVAVDPGRDLGDVDEPGALVIRVVCERRLDPVNIREQLRIPRRRGAPQLQHPIQLLQLGDPDCRLEVSDPVVEPEADVVEPARGVRAALVAEDHDLLALLFRMRRDHPTLAGRQLLVRIEAERARGPVRADRRALVLRPERLTGVVDQPEPVPLRDRAQLVELARVAEHVDDDDPLCALRDRRLDRIRIEVQRPRVDIREDWDTSLDDEAVRRRDERDRGRDHLVARLHARDVAEQVQPGGAARHRSRIGRADALGDQLLEAIDRRTEREPARAQDLQDELLLALIDERARERNASLGSHASAGAAFPTLAYSSHCAQRSLLPRQVSRYAVCSAFVTGPGGPTTRSSTSRIGVTSAAVPVMKISSAVTRSERMRFFSSTVYPRSCAIWISESRVIPGRIEVDSGGVVIFPSLTTKTFSPEPSAMNPSAVSRIASS